MDEVLLTVKFYGETKEDWSHQPAQVKSREEDKEMKRTGDQRLYKGTLPLTHHHSFEFLRLCQGCLDPLSLFNIVLSFKTARQ